MSASLFQTPSGHLYIVRKPEPIQSGGFVAKVPLNPTQCEGFFFDLWALLHSTHSAFAGRLQHDVLTVFCAAEQREALGQSLLQATASLPGIKWYWRDELFVLPPEARWVPRALI